LLTVALATVSFAANPINLIFKGLVIKPDVPPQLINGRTMVPAGGSLKHWVLMYSGMNKSNMSFYTGKKD
jgi:hypothetical protein